MGLEEGRVTANGVDFAYLAAGPADGPLALCLHGFPDTAWGFRHLLPELAAAGYRAVAPFMRGYAPTSVPHTGHYQSGALVADACALHDALGADGRAALIGHDWGAVAVWGAASYRPDQWRRIVAASVPPSARLFSTYDQIKRSFYMFFFQQPMAEAVVAMDDFAFIARLWEDWSPGYDATDDLDYVKRALGAGPNLTAALGYYRASFDPARQSPDLAEAQKAIGAPHGQPTLYLHGAQDGCIGVALVDGVEGRLPEGSKVEILDGAGHFLHLERPAEVNARILSFLSEA